MKVARRDVGFVILAGLIVTSGCLVPPDDDDSPLPEPIVDDSISPVFPVDGCYQDICPADPDDHDPAYMRQRYNLTQVNADERGELNPRMEGSLVTWQVVRRDAMNRPASDIFGFDLQSNRVIPISTGSGNHSTRAELADGRVVWAQERVGNGSWPSFSLLLWDAATGDRRAVETPLDGETLPLSFDGSWLTVQTRGNSNLSHDGVWAVNVDDERAHQVWQANPDPARAWISEFQAGAVVGQHVYWGERRTTQDKTRTNLILNDLNLTTGQPTVIYEESGGAIRQFDVDGGLMVWEAAYSGEFRVIRVLDLESRQAWDLTNISEKGSFPRIGGQWVVFDLTRTFDGSGRGVVVQHVLTGERVVVVPREPELQPEGYYNVPINGQEADTDGQRVLAEVYRNFPERFEHATRDLYWQWLPGQGEDA